MDNLNVENARIVTAKGRPIHLRGVNLGNWLLLEGYMLCGPNKPERSIRRSIAREHGPQAARTFFRRYQEIYIQETDLRRIKAWGFNVLRVPFNHRLFLAGDSLYAQNGWDRLDWLIRQCSKLGLYCILDMHAAPGAQNHDWHSDSDGRAGLWTSTSSRRRMVSLWKKIAERYKNEPAVAGYDLLNEPILKETEKLNRLYQDGIQAIRSVGDKHIVFLEGTNWSTDLSVLDGIRGENIACSIHFYEPVHFTFNDTLDTSYPGKIDGKLWNKNALRRILGKSAAWARSRKMPVLLGEFGVNGRCPSRRAETAWLKDVLSLSGEFGFHWTYWAYKSISGHMFPTGLMRFPQNPPWLRREGVTTGWENFGLLSFRDRREILRFMDSQYFTVDEPLVVHLRKK